MCTLGVDMSDADRRVVRASEASDLGRTDGGSFRLVERDQLGLGEISVGLSDNPAGAGGLMHRHSCGEVFVVYEGRGIYTIDDKEIIAEPGDMVIIPPHTWHSFRPMETPACVTLRCTTAVALTSSFRRAASSLNSDLSEPRQICRSGTNSANRDWVIFAPESALGARRHDRHGGVVRARQNNGRIARRAVDLSRRRLQIALAEERSSGGRTTVFSCACYVLPAVRTAPDIERSVVRHRAGGRGTSDRVTARCGPGFRWDRLVAGALGSRRSVGVLEPRRAPFGRVVLGADSATGMPPTGIAYVTVLR